VDVAVGKLAPIAREMRRLTADPAYIDGILAEGAARARAIARPNMDAVKDIVGFVRAR
jgi:tryptophanyl-tRNA synthetase